MVSEIGFNPYASLLITRQATIDDRRDVVEKIVRAGQRGWQQYLDDPATTNAHIARINPDMAVDVLDYGATQIAQLCRVEGDNAVVLGTMTSQRWQTLIEQLAELKLVDVRNREAGRLLHDGVPEVAKPGIWSRGGGSVFSQP